jgi:hypothetical protein
MATIEFQDVTKRLGNDTLAVDNLTLDVREGELAGQPFVLPRHCTQIPSYTGGSTSSQARRLSKPRSRLRERSRRHPDVVGLGLLVSRDTPRVERSRDRAVRTGRAR